MPKNVGMISGRYVLIHPNWLNKMYCGTMTISYGSSIVSIMQTNHRLRPRKRMREKPNAMTADDRTLPIVEMPTTRNVFLKNVVNVTPATPFHPLM